MHICGVLEWFVDLTDVFVLGAQLFTINLRKMDGREIKRTVKQISLFDSTGTKINYIKKVQFIRITDTEFVILFF